MGEAAVLGALGDVVDGGRRWPPCRPAGVGGGAVGPAAAPAIAGAARRRRHAAASAVRAARSRTARHFGSRSFSTARIGVAMKIDEYEPVMSPTSRATAKSCNATAPRIHEPTTSSDSTGSTAARLVLSDRISVWFIDRLTISP